VFNEPVVVADSPPPPVSGGTLTVIAGGRRAALADSDRDQVNVVDLDALAVVTTVSLDKGDEPGRVIEDAAGRVHVALRGSGAIAALDVTTGSVLSRRSVCPHPRGLAYDASTDVVHVACVGGELVTVPAAGGDPIRTLRLDRDLRDIVVDGDHLFVSRFRSAELLVVESNGVISSRLAPPRVSGDATGELFAPAVAWRTIAAPGGGALMVLQREQSSDVVIEPGGYGGSRCGAVVQGAVARFKADGTVWMSDGINVALPVDIATNADGSKTVVAGARVLSPNLLSRTGASVVDVAIAPPPTLPPSLEAGIGPSDSAPPIRQCAPAGSPDLAAPDQEQVVAVSFDAKGRLLVQTRKPSLFVDGRLVTLPGAAIADTGHELFHLATLAGLACASCHPEGREDGHVWNFSPVRLRRTQAIGGGILGTEPFHWTGDMHDFGMLAHEVFNSRMSGPSLQPEHVAALANWINTIPPWRASVAADDAAAERGRLVFNDPAVGCASCHSGAKMTNNITVNVGTGLAFQVPALRGVGFRAPFLHNGCAATLLDRFGSCGGGDMHGHTSGLSMTERTDLVAYLETL
jgi:hypothetical protein